jgi:hypothetical protein
MRARSLIARRRRRGLGVRGERIVLLVIARMVVKSHRLRRASARSRALSFCFICLPRILTKAYDDRLDGFRTATFSLPFFTPL